MSIWEFVIEVVLPRHKEVRSGALHELNARYTQLMRALRRQDPIGQSLLMDVPASPDVQKAFESLREFVEEKSTENILRSPNPGPPLRKAALMADSGGSGHAQ